VDVGPERDWNHFLNTYLKDRLNEIGGVEPATPMSTDLPAGFTVFRVAARTVEEVQKVMQDNKIIVSPAYLDARPVVRMSPGLPNSTEEIDEAVDVLREIAQGRSALPDVRQLS